MDINTTHNLLGVSSSDFSYMLIDETVVRYAMTVVVLLLGPGNLVVIVVYATKLTTSTRIYMFNLACTDTSICVLAIVLGGVFGTHLSNLSELILVFVYNIALYNSMLVLTLISVERFFCIKTPLEFNFSERRARFGSCAIFTLSVLGSCVLMTGRLFPALTGYARLFLLFTVCAAFVTMTLAYTGIAELMLRRSAARRSRLSYSSSSNTSVEVTSVSDMRIQLAPVIVKKITKSPKSSPCLTIKQRASIKRMKKSIRLMLTITLAFVLCWSPIAAIAVGFKVHPGFAYLFVLNSVINPIIYSFMSTLFRRDVKERFAFFCSKTPVAI